MSTVRLLNNNGIIFFSVQCSLSLSLTTLMCFFHLPATASVQSEGWVPEYFCSSVCQIFVLLESCFLATLLRSWWGLLLESQYFLCEIGLITTSEKRQWYLVSLSFFLPPNWPIYQKGLYSLISVFHRPPRFVFFLNGIKGFFISALINIHIQGTYRIPASLIYVHFCLFVDDTPLWHCFLVTCICVSDFFSSAEEV